jgi:hypothetical protein
MKSLFSVLALGLLGSAHADFTKTVKQKGDCSAGIVAYVRGRANLRAWPSTRSITVSFLFLSVSVRFCLHH